MCRFVLLIINNTDAYICICMLMVQIIEENNDGVIVRCSSLISLCSCGSSVVKE